MSCHTVLARAFIFLKMDPSPFSRPIRYLLYQKKKGIDRIKEEHCGEFSSEDFLDVRAVGCRIWSSAISGYGNEKVEISRASLPDTSCSRLGALFSFARFVWEDDSMVSHSEGGERGKKILIIMAQFSQWCW